MDDIREKQRKALKATGDMGYANGLRAAAVLLRRMTDHKGRVVGTNDLKSVAECLDEQAAELDRKAQSAIKEINDNL